MLVCLCVSFFPTPNSMEAGVILVFPQPGSVIPITLESVTSLGPPPAVSPADCPH